MRMKQREEICLQRTGVANDPQLGRSVVNVCVGRESRTSISSVNDVAGVVARALLIRDGGRGGHEG